LVSSSKFVFSTFAFSALKSLYDLSTLGSFGSLGLPPAAILFASLLASLSSNVVSTIGSAAGFYYAGKICNFLP
jgi:hypothetical protein